MTSRAVETAARLQKMLQQHGYEASRHASSMLILHNGKIIASIHVYPEECIIHPYTLWLPETREALTRLQKLLQQGCPQVVRSEPAPKTPPV